MTMTGGKTVSFLSKLLGGDKKAEKAARDLLNNLLGNSANQSSTAQTVTSEPYRPQATASVQHSAPSGDSWGEYMPAEENQFNFNGPFTDYFEKIFREDFPAYRFEKTFEGNGRRIIYTFYSSSGRVLVVELMPESSSANKIRKECEKAGIGYLRFYYDHEGWWNTRSYVTRRIRTVLV